MEKNCLKSCENDYFIDILEVIVYQGQYSWSSSHEDISVPIPVYGPVINTDYH